MSTVFLLLGGNEGNRQLYLQQAIEKLNQQVGKVVKASAVYETQAWGKTDEADYLNQVLMLQTDLQPHIVLDTLLQIEQELGRQRQVKWGARTIDIDILFYNEEIINEPGLTIPHPQLQNRGFTLEPLAEIAPDFIHPILLRNMQQLKNDLKDCLVVKKL